MDGAADNLRVGVLDGDGEGLSDGRPLYVLVGMLLGVNVR